MYPILRAVASREDHTLLLHFASGETRLYDMRPLVEKNPLFRDLAVIPGLFMQATVDVGGEGVSWNEAVDIAASELYVNSKPYRSDFDGLLALSDAATLWGLHESTLRKAVTYGRLVPGTDILKFGKQWVVTRAAMEREYGKLPGTNEDSCGGSPQLAVASCGGLPDQTADPHGGSPDQTADPHGGSPSHVALTYADLLTKEFPPCGSFVAEGPLPYKAEPLQVTRNASLTPETAFRDSLEAALAWGSVLGYSDEYVDRLIREIRQQKQ